MKKQQTLMGYTSLSLTSCRWKITPATNNNIIFRSSMILCCFVMIIITNPNVHAFTATILPTTASTKIHPIVIDQQQQQSILSTLRQNRNHMYPHQRLFSTPSSSSSSSSPSSSSTTPSTAATTTTSISSSESFELPYTFELLKDDVICDAWELDCYSRPVMVENGKKLWEILITDSADTFRYIHTIPSNQVNSKQLRSIIENLIDNIVSENQKPNTIRFFRGAMFNMISIALAELPVVAKPSRCTFVLSNWLEKRHREVYPKMNGYNKNMISSTNTNSFLNVRTPVKLPDALRGEKYAFVGLPLAEFLPNTGSVNSDNIGVGKLCPLPNAILSNHNQLPAGDTFVQGIVILTNRAKALASWLSSTEMIGMRCDLRKRIVTMETDIDTQYLMAKLNDQQRMEAAIFEEGKDLLYGLHFISIQQTENDEVPAGFWLLREPPTNI